MACQICGAPSKYYPLCSVCNAGKEKGEITKCKECGKWKNNNHPHCKDCWLKHQNEQNKKTADYKETPEITEEKNFRNKFPPKFRAEDGHLVRSRAELLIDNWLFHKGIAHAYERRVPIEKEMYCDFFIPFGKKIWIEFWGLDEEKYEKRKEMKKSYYKKDGKNLIELTAKDVDNLDDILPQLLRPFLPTSFTFE